MRFFLRFFVLLLLAVAPASQAIPVWEMAQVTMEDMTWQEVAAAIKAGKTTVIVPTGGTEQNGPHIILGKHNYIIAYTGMTIAQRLGNALVAPVMPYVPEGTIRAPSGHMRFAGTLSLRPVTFAAFLEDTARSLKAHGFKLICFVGEHGESQAVQKWVAEKLSEEWKSEGVRVLQVGDYYDEHNGQSAWYEKNVKKGVDIEAHGGIADTSEMMALRPGGVRDKLRGPYTAADMDKLGAAGSSVEASVTTGAKLVDMKISAAVKQIQAVQAGKE